jgi:EAL domain-containing protein (putative c-di-GMP-specific phosphodiesterase class I)
MNSGDERYTCCACKDGIEQPFPFSMAFQPIVDVRTARVYAFEALVRGTDGESADSILGRVDQQNRYAFDQSCRVKAITLAAELDLAETGAFLSINFMPGAVYSPAACIRLTLDTASSVGFPCERLIFEITEAERIRDMKHLRHIIDEYQRRGFKMAIDDFGAGYAGLNLLADFPADIIKIDMALVRDVGRRPAALAIVKMIVGLARSLGTEIVAEGVETVEEYVALLACDIRLMQGFLIARPGFETLPAFALPILQASA